MVRVTAEGVSAMLWSIDYDKKTALVEIDYTYLVIYPWYSIVIN